MTAFCNDLSARNRRWELRPAPNGVPAIPGVPAQVAEIITRRGVTDVEEYLKPSLRGSMPNPSVLKDMDAAVERLWRAIEGREKIAVFGDYDVDGATSTALMTRWLRLVGVSDSTFYIPQRLTEGYGPKPPAMQTLHERGVQLLIVVDSGTGAFPAIERAVELGMEVIVLDHHEATEDGRLPPAIVVNPKRLDDTSDLDHLCTAGLAFMCLVAANRYARENGQFSRLGVAEPDLRELLGLVALGTVADMVPLKGLNRAFVRVGLAMMSHIPGIRALCEATGETEFSARTCGFVFGPCINAGGRISDTMQGSRLLTTDDITEAREIAANLFEENRTRQDMQKEMIAAVIDRVEKDHPNDPVVVVHDQAWHPGVVGLCANKVKDHFDRTAIVIGTDGKGSGRSVEGFNIGRSFGRAYHELGLLAAGGGHAAAGGLTVDLARLAEFRAFMIEEARGLQRPPARVDLVAPIGTLSFDTIDAFSLLAPFGMGNARPRVAITGGILDRVRILKGAHVQCYLVAPDRQSEVKVIVFRCVGTPLGDALVAAEGHYVDLMGEVEIDTYGGTAKVQIKPEDAMIGLPATALAAAAA